MSYQPGITTNCSCILKSGLPSNEEAEKGASFARQTEIVNCRLRDETPAAIIIKANIQNFNKNNSLCI